MGFLIRDLHKTFSDRNGSTIEVLQDVNLDVGEGEFVSLVGPSGCGKSSLLRIIAGLIPPSRGKVSFLEEPGEGMLRTAMVFQEQALYPWMTVEENILFRRGRASQAERRAAESMMDAIGLVEFRNYFPHQLSGGLRQRAALARAFLASPMVILMDEPFGALDAQTRLILQEELLRIWNDHRVTVVFVTHDIDEAIRLGDRVLVMSYRPGRILEEVQIDFPRPRQLELQQLPSFHALKSQIWNLLHDEVRESMGSTSLRGSG